MSKMFLAANYHDRDAEYDISEDDINNEGNINNNYYDGNDNDEYVDDTIDDIRMIYDRDNLE